MERGKELTKWFEDYRPDVYRDSRGNPTGGWGHHFFVGSRLPESIWAEIFAIDYQNAYNGYRALHLYLDSVREAVVVDMIFNLGMRKFYGFRKMISALQRGDHFKAADEMVDSDWYRQVGRRGPILEKMMRTGEWATTAFTEKIP